MVNNDLIDLKDCIIGNTYEIVLTCEEPRFFEIGIFPTQQIQLMKYQGGLYQVKVSETIWAVREEQGNCIKVKEI